MRFHIGFSKRISIKTLITILGTIFVGLLAFFGITEHEIVYADGTFNTAPSSIQYYRNNSGSPIYTCGGNTGALCTEQSVCSSFGNGPCIPAEASAFQSFEPFNMTYNYPALNLCSNNSYTATISMAFIVQYPRGTKTNGNLSVISPSGARITNFTIDSNYVATFDVTYDTRQALSLRVNASSGYVYYTQFRRNNDYTCQYTSQDAANDIINNNNSNTNSIINNNNQNTQNIINSQNEINNSINDDSIDTALDTGNDFFDNFNVDDSRGFSSIVTAPIQFLRDLLTSSHSCSPLSISFNPNDGTHSGTSTWSIPCGDILWSKAPNTIILLWYTIIYGLLGYRILVDMMRFINRTLNPEDTSEYIMDL